MREAERPPVLGGGGLGRLRPVAALTSLLAVIFSALLFALGWLFLPGEPVRVPEAQHSQVPEAQHSLNWTLLTAGPQGMGALWIAWDAGGEACLGAFPARENAYFLALPAQVCLAHIPAR